ncbi:MAG: BMP family ABC transporter substrate-binding protein, partial [Clostridia bacterium]
MRKKLLVLLLVVAMLVGCVGIFAACSGTENNEFKIGVIHIGDPKDGGYSAAHDEGIVEMQKNLKLKDSQIVRKLNVSDTDASATKTAIEECIAAGCKMIYATSYGYMDTCDALAKDYPNVIFSHGTGYKSNATNMNNYFGRIYQARFLSGIAAGLKTQTNKIGYVSAFGDELAETCSGISAFAMGVYSVNPNAQIFVKKLNTWFDQKNEKGFAEDLISTSNCDVIAQHCDTTGPQVAAQENKVWGVGYNMDMTEAAPDAHLTATIWNWGVYYTAATKAAIEGNWNSFDRAYYKGIAEGLVGVSPVTKNCAEGTQEKIDAVTKIMKDGTWDVFTGKEITFKGNLPVLTDRALSITTNDGKTVEVAAGDGKLSDGVIKGSMKW